MGDPIDRSYVIEPLGQWFKIHDKSHEKPERLLIVYFLLKIVQIVV